MSVESEMTRIVRRVVTGHNDKGKSVILQDGPVPGVHDKLAQAGLVFMEVWETGATPAPISPEEPEPTDHALQLVPPKHGVRIRVLDIPPEGEGLPDTAGEDAAEVFSKIGAGHALDKDAAHPYMHRTETVDFGIILEGEIVLIMDEGETTVRAGDVVIQRGTNHAWANRSDQPCRVAFILVDGTYDESLSFEPHP